MRRQWPGDALGAGTVVIFTVGVVVGALGAAAIATLLRGWC